MAIRAEFRAQNANENDQISSTLKISRLYLYVRKGVKILYVVICLCLSLQAIFVQSFSAKMVTLLSVSLPHSGKFSETNEYAEAVGTFSIF